MWCNGLKLKVVYPPQVSLKHLRTGASVSFPYKGVWEAQLQPKICLFAWETSGLKLLTSDMAQKRRWSLANRCYLCFKERETIEPVYTLCENKSHGNFFFPLIGLLGNAFLGERDFNQLARIFCGEKRLESNTSTFTLDNLE